MSVRSEIFYEKNVRTYRGLKAGVNNKAIQCICRKILYSLSATAASEKKTLRRRYETGIVFETERYIHIDTSIDTSIGRSTGRQKDTQTYTERRKDSSSPGKS